LRKKRGRRAETEKKSKGGKKWTSELVSSKGRGTDKNLQKKEIRRKKNQAGRVVF